MAAIKSTGNKSTEGAFLNLLRKERIAGWRKHYKKVKGAPDFVFPKQKIAVFIDGCFWHKCPKCFIAPVTRKKFWQKKIDSNISRDKKINTQLRKDSWTVLRFWEHDVLKNKERVSNKIYLTLRRTQCDKSKKKIK